MLPKAVWVVAHNGGCEGHSLPLLAFANEADAVAWCRGQTEAFSVARVPVYPQLPVAPWFEIEAVWLKQEKAA
jgi:hypothetical protein